MSDDFIEVPVKLTRDEVTRIGKKAKSEGVSTSDFLSYCIRCVAFSVITAVNMLPKQGQVGTRDEQE
jgi:hypothetical protein